MRRVIMKRSELSSKYRNIPTDDNEEAFKIQSKIFGRLHKQERRQYYEKLDLRKITDNKKLR